MGILIPVPAARWFRRLALALVLSAYALPLPGLIAASLPS